MLKPGGLRPMRKMDNLKMDSMYSDERSRKDFDVTLRSRKIEIGSLKWGESGHHVESTRTKPYYF